MSLLSLFVFRVARCWLVGLVTGELLTLASGAGEVGLNFSED